MGNIFYNSVSIIVGLILISYFVFSIVKKHTWGNHSLMYVSTLYCYDNIIVIIKKQR